jgi:hypothetical protein
VIAIGFAAVSWFSLSYTYADGDRAGYRRRFAPRLGVQDLEGEMALVTQPGTMSEKFLFTVRDDKVAQALTTSVGTRVAIHYEQHKWIPNSCFGDTEYFVTTAAPVPATQPLP